MKHRHKGGKFKYIFIIIFLVGIVFIYNHSAKIMFPIKYKEVVKEYSEKFTVDPFLVLAIIKVESNFKPNAVSSKNARGLMQITEKTGKWGASVLNIRNYETESLYNPEINISIGCWYLGTLLDEFHNNVDLALAAYNGGSGNVTEWLKNKDYSDTGETLQKIPFKETERYINKVRNYYDIYKRLYEKSF